MEFDYFIGIDVSKRELDFVVIRNKEKVLHKETENTHDSIMGFIRELKKQPGFKMEKAVFCMEHTGIYNNHLLGYFQKRHIHVCVESAVQIKQSLGLQRGKNDKIDAFRIAQYAYKNRDELKLWEPARQELKELKALATTRARLVSARKQLSTAAKEGDGYVDKKIFKTVQSSCTQSLKALTNDIEKIEKKIHEIINKDAVLKKLFEQVTSITGIGPVTAAEVIITTNEFKSINDPRKYSCYAGVAPFEHSSGSSIRGRTRVSHLANKTVKTLLHMSALVAISYNDELKAYYERKVAEGKNKMSVINAVRNKLILRIFACVNQNKKYEKFYSHCLV